MFRRLSLIGLALLCSVSAFAQAPPAKAPPPPVEVDKDEVERRGNMVQDVGSTQASEIDLIAESLAPPADDSHKWYITVVTQNGCPPCEALKKAFAEKPELRAWANPGEPDQSWSHYQVRSVDDATQKAWFKGIREHIVGFPSIVIQPPRNNAYGDNTTTVTIIKGYDGDPKKLSAKIRESITVYVAAIQRQQLSTAPAPRTLWSGPTGKYKPRGVEQQLPFTPPADPFTVDPNTPATVFPPAPQPLTFDQIQASVQAINGPGFAVPADFVLQMLQTGVRTVQEVQQHWQTFLGRRQPQPAPQVTPQPSTPAPAQTNVLDLVRDVLDVLKPQQQPAATPSATPSSGGIGEIINTVLNAGSWAKWLAMFIGATSAMNVVVGGLQLWRTFRKVTGQPTLLDDETFKKLVDALQANTNATNLNNVVSAQDALKAALSPPPSPM